MTKDEKINIKKELMLLYEKADKFKTKRDEITRNFYEMIVNALNDKSGKINGEKIINAHKYQYENMDGIVYAMIKIGHEIKICKDKLSPRDVNGRFISKTKNYE